MDPPCEIGDESLTIGGAVNEDRISDLPDALLLQILSLLPTETAVAISVLSKRWKSLWKMLPNLTFTYHGRTDLEIFQDNVCRCLLSYDAPVLQSLHLNFSSHKGNGIDIGVLVGIAVGLIHVRKLILAVFFDDFEVSIRFPISVLNCETLETLKLSDSILLDVPSPICLKSLRTLHLNNVDYKDDESVRNLLSGCIRLENLVVNRYGHDRVKTFTISVPSLHRLTIVDDDCDSHYVIAAPSLKYLTFKAYGLLGSFLIENTPEMVEADIEISYAFCENILRSLTSVKRLRLSLKISPLKITIPTVRTFDQLAYLELCTYQADCWNLLTLMLDTSPNLHVLKLDNNDFSHLPRQYLNLMPWNQPKNVPKCLLLHLETFVWTFYEGKLEDDKEVAKYILRNASRLKKAVFSKIILNSKERVEMVEELESVVRASNSCQLMFE